MAVATMGAAPLGSCGVAGVGTISRYGQKWLGLGLMWSAAVAIRNQMQSTGGRPPTGQIQSVGRLDPAEQYFAHSAL